MSKLSDFIRQCEDAIMDEWLCRVEKLHASHGLPELALRDSLPDLLARMSEVLEEGDLDVDDVEAKMFEHGRERYHSEYAVAEVVREYQELRAAIVLVWEREHGDEAQPPDLAKNFAVMHRLVDEAIGTSVEAFQGQHDQERQRLAAILAHDLRSPLSTMNMGAQVLMRRDTLRESDARIVEQIGRAGQRMSRMIADLLDYARTRAGTSIPIEPSEQDLGEICRAAVEEIEVAHPDRRLSLTCRGDLAGCWDRARLEQIVSNLVHNALAHGEEPVAVTAHPDDGDADWICLSVCNGGELSKEEEAHIFEPFTSCSSSRGVGLGLFVVCEVARGHGGDVEVESAEGTVRFSVRLPRRAAPGKAAQRGG